MEPVPLAVVLLVDARGWVLLQERDAGAPRAPDQWGMVGGHVEDGEDFEPAAYRELAEETGLELAPGTLRLWRDVANGRRVAGAQEVTWLMLKELNAAPGQPGPLPEHADLAVLLRSIHLETLRANARSHALAIAAA